MLRKSIHIIRKLLHLLFILAVTHEYAFSQSYNEILGRPTDHSITISILAKQDLEVFWEYGPAAGIYLHTTDTIAVTSNLPFEYEIINLSADAGYHYRIRYRNAGSSGVYQTGDDHRFHTQRAPGSSFTFTIESDEHLYDKKGVKSLYRICLENQAMDEPDFMISVGDIFGDDRQPQNITPVVSDSLHIRYRPFLGSVCHSVPFYVCLGNHEGENSYYLAQAPPDNLAVWGTLWRKFYFPNPFPNNFYTGNTTTEPFGMDAPENYYAWTWGDALFVVLDVYRFQSDTTAKPKKWDWTLGMTQYSWLKNTLENSNATFKIVFAHQVRGQGRGGILDARYYEWGGYEEDSTTWGFTANRPGWAKPIHQLFVDNAVNIFFHGHDHLFAHEVLDGVVYQEIPMPSDSTYKIGVLANGDAYASDTVYGSGHLRVAVSPSCMTVDFVRAWLPADTLNGIHHNAETAFSYTIGNCPATPVNDNQPLSEIKVYPNPAENTIYVSSPSGLEYDIVLLNMLGQTLLQSRSNRINISQIPDGMYLLQINTGHHQLLKKVIVRKSL